MTQPTEYDVNTVTARYLELRDEKEQREAQHKADMEVLDEKLDACAAFLEDNLKQANASSMRTSSGTVIRSLKRRYQLRDSGEFLNYLRTTGRIELLQNRISSTAIKEFEDDNAELPPGVGVDEAFTISVRKSRS